MRSLTPRRWLVSVLSVLLVAPGPVLSGNPQAAQPTKVVAGLPSATRLLGDLEWIVSTLAGEKETWEDVVLPTAELFLLGVDPDRPLGANVIFENDGGHRNQFQIPLKDLGEFREENLAPIDITSRRKGRDYYELTSKTLGYNGWMRIVDDYASISKHAEDVPEGMPSPRKELDALLQPGYDAAARAHNTNQGIADRRATFAEFRKNRQAGITRRPLETPEAFALRRRVAEHQAQRIERIFVEAESLLATWVTDAEKQEARGQMVLTALAGTDLASVITKFGSTPSYFAAVPTSDDALVHGRMNIPIDKTLQQQADEFYELVGPVWKQRIDGDDELTAGQKEARRKICDLGLAMLHDGRALHALDACIEITPAANGANVLIAGIRAADGTKGVEILQLIPEAIGDVELQLNVETAGDAAIHRLKSTGKIPDSLKAFYGADGEVFVATHKDAVWLAAGPGSLDKLRQTIALAGTPADAQPSGEVLVGVARLGPMIKHLDDLAVETGFSLEKFLGHPIQPQPQEEDDADAPKKHRPGQALAEIDWRGLALPVLLESTDDHFTLRVSQKEGAIHGDMHIERGVLKAAGKVIAKVSADKLQ